MEDRYLSLDKKYFMKWFKKNGYTFPLYDYAVEQSMSSYKTNDMFQKNKCAPSVRQLHRYLETGKIPFHSAVLLCQFFDVTPNEIGIVLS